VYGKLANVTVEDEVQALVEEAEEKMSGVDILINNAGLGGTRLLVEMADEEWTRVLDITLTGTMRMTRAMLRRMQPRGAGVIVNNASVLGWRAQKEQCHYAAAKAGVMALTRCAALEAAEYGIRINAVSPSLATHKFLSKVMPQDVLDELTAREAFGRGAEPWEVANVMVFLASDYSSYMTGECVPVSSQHP
jgi:3-oxoacyl-[acyl-carrier protein] reductase